MVEFVRFDRFRSLPGAREVLARPGHGCVFIHVPKVRDGIGVTTSKRGEEYEAFRLGITVDELRRRKEQG